MDREEDLPVASPMTEERDALLTGTPAFDALFAALEQSVPLSDPASLGLLLGSNLVPFG